MKTKIEKIWSSQESGSPREVLRERIDEVREVPCFIGLIGSTGARILQLEIGSEITVHPNFLNKFRGIEIQNFVSNSGIQKFTIILLERKLNDVFLLFIVDILERLVAVNDPREALTIIHQRVSYWRQLFARVSGELLSPVQQRGLYGELLFLKCLLENKQDQEVILNSWKGSESANQDFALNAVAVEIKTSKAGIPNISISNEHQLDYTHWKNLYLGVISLNESAGKENTLSSLIQEILIILEKDIKLQNLFEEKLSLAGIASEMVKKYDDITYSVRRKFFFKVHEGFPLIIPSHFKDTSIFNIKYQIDIDSCKAYEVKEGTVINEYHG